MAKSPNASAFRRKSPGPSNWTALLTEAHAWQLWTTEFSPALLEKKCFKWLTADERAHAQHLQTPQLRHEYLSARFLCRAALSQYAAITPAAWKFSAGLHGKPQIDAPRAFTFLRFNLTHAQGLVICLISRAGELGVDAEETSRDVDIAQVTKHFFSKRERESLDRLLPQRRASRFFRQWVLKEAYLKATGRGLSLEPNRFTVEIDRSGNPTPLRGWQFTLRRLGPNHVAATALRPKHAAALIPIKWRSARRLLEARVPIE